MKLFVLVCATLAVLSEAQAQFQPLFLPANGLGASGALAGAQAVSSSQSSANGLGASGAQAYSGAQSVAGSNVITGSQGTSGAQTFSGAQSVAGAGATSGSQAYSGAQSVAGSQVISGVQPIVIPGVLPVQVPQPPPQQPAQPPPQQPAQPPQTPAPQPPAQPPQTPAPIPNFISQIISQIVPTITGFLSCYADAVLTIITDFQNNLSATTDLLSGLAGSFFKLLTGAVSDFQTLYQNAFENGGAVLDNLSDAAMSVIGIFQDAIGLALDSVGTCLMP